MNSTYNGSDLTVAVAGQTVKAGDYVTYDQSQTTENGRFLSLNQFKAYLDKNFKYENLSGEDHYNSWCFYGIIEVL